MRKESERKYRMITLINLILLTLLYTTDVCAQTTPPKLEINNPQSVAEIMMMQYDFDRDGIITEKEFIIGNGESGYRAHLSNIYESLNSQDKEEITKQQYWFIEMRDAAKYKKDLLSYFEYLDNDSDGYITTEEYESTFTGKYIENFGRKYAQAIDSNKDNKISKSEYLNFDFTSLQSGSHEQFRNIDANSDNILTSEEMKQIFEKQW